MTLFQRPKDVVVCFINKILSQGQMEVILPNEIDIKPADSFHLPHHSITKSYSNKTKLRLVFDASAKTSFNVSLNSNLMMDPKI